MTDLIPNDLSHLSDKEFNALRPQGEHAPGPEPLSPAAQAVMHSLWGADLDNCQSMDDIRRRQAAAALRAAADQVVPLPRLPYDSCCDVSASAIRADILAIAAELDGRMADQLP